MNIYKQPQIIAFHTKKKKQYISYMFVGYLIRVRSFTAAHMLRPVFPLLCECQKKDGYVEHASLCRNYVLWVLPDRRHIAFVHRIILANGVSNKGLTFGELLISKHSPEEPCKMISRPLLQTLGYKPDYVVVTESRDEVPTPLTSGYSMATLLNRCAKNPTMEHIRTLAEGPGEPSGPRNQVGQLLSQLSQRLASNGFFADAKYFPQAQRDMAHLAEGMSLDELRLRKLFKAF